MDVDPTLDERRYVRHRRTGERGYLVVRGGVERVRLDRPQETTLPRTDDWDDDMDVTRLTLQQVARVAYAADMELLRALGHYQPETAWLSLVPKVRIALVEKGPSGADVAIRKLVWEAIWSVLRPLAK